LREDSCCKDTGHAIEMELGRESEGRELGLSSILEGQGLEADEVFAADGPNGGIRGEVECGNERDIDAGVKSLEGSLLLGISGVDGDFSGTELGKAGGIAIILPCNNSRLSTGIARSGNGGGHEDSSESCRSSGEDDEYFGEHRGGV